MVSKKPIIIQGQPIFRYIMTTDRRLLPAAASELTLRVRSENDLVVTFPPIALVAGIAKKSSNTPEVVGAS